MYQYKIFSNFFNDKLVINGLFLKKKNIVLSKLTCMQKYRYNAMNIVTIVYGGTKLQIVVY